MIYKDLPPRIKKMVKPVGNRYALVFCDMIVDVYDSIDELVSGLIGLERMLPKEKPDAPRAYHQCDKQG